MIEESWNPIEPEARLGSPNQKWKSHMLPSLDEYLHAKNLTYHLIPSKDIVDQRILHFDLL